VLPGARCSPDHAELHIECICLHQGRHVSHVVAAASAAAAAASVAVATAAATDATANVEAVPEPLSPPPFML